MPSIDDVLGEDSDQIQIDIAERERLEANPHLIEVVQLEEGEIDPRLKLLSHSSRQTLHKCPRKYQLYRLNGKQEVINPKEDTQKQEVTFAFGHAVGVGMQSVLEKKDESTVIMDTFLSWSTDLLDYNPKQKKSFASALFAVQRFQVLVNNGFLEEYDLLYMDGKPAVELAFQVTLPDGFVYRGFLDAVLEHKLTGEILVLENKTSSSAAVSATFKNSGQALGYSVVLDKLVSNLSSYTVLYCVYETKSYEFVEMPFSKSLLQRALWLQELIIDTHLIQLYDSYDVYPMHGENCYDFFRECEYINTCTMDTGVVTKPLTRDAIEKMEKAAEVYTYSVDFRDLIAEQIAKGESEGEVI